MSALASVVSDETGPYRPSDDEPFMNERQLAYFKKKLLDWKDEILRESKGTVVNLKAETENHPDLVDRASSESDRALELRTRDRQRKLISKIDDACGGSRTAPTAIARTPANPLAWVVWRLAPPRPCRSRRRSATNAASGFTGTTEVRGTKP